MSGKGGYAGRKNVTRGRGGRSNPTLTSHDSVPSQVFLQASPFTSLRLVIYAPSTEWQPDRDTSNQDLDTCTAPPFDRSITGILDLCKALRN